MSPHCHRLIAIVVLVSSLHAVAELDFNRDVRPILSDNCVLCHGPDAKKRKAKLRLDTFEGATEEHSWGKAVVPGNPAASVLVERIKQADPDERMPPPESHLSLSKDEIALLEQWVREGAKYDTHWAFKPPTKATLPELPAKMAAWPRNGIDHFVGQRLEREGLQPSPEADKRTLLRRVTLDLTGLPPTPAEIADFLADDSANAYDKVVDRLLASPSYGEHMTFQWLDAARYADTDGYQSDKARTMWPWRDWVIRAYNSNMPFDQFTIEQLAGDMLPEPTLQQRLATGFNRNHRINNEGGALPEEFIVEYVADRVETTGAVWLGLTFGCARCHDHKYDPILQKDYFQLFAIFNGIAEQGKDAGAKARPNMQVPRDPNSPAIKQAEETLAAAETARTKALAGLDVRQAAWEKAAAQPLAWEPVDSEVATGKQVIAKPGNTVSALRLAADATLPKNLRASIVPPGETPQVGRFVRIQIPGKGAADKYLCLAEVEVFSGAENVARKGKASQSTTGYNGPAALAIDGKTNPTFTSKTITHTTAEVSPWWEVDLGRDVAVSAIKLWNRAENIHSRLDGADVTLLDDKRQPVWQGNVGKATPEPKNFALSGARSFELTGADDGIYSFPNQTNLPPGSILELASAKSGAALPPAQVTVCRNPAASEAQKPPAKIGAILAVTPGKRTPAQIKALTEHYRGIDSEVAAADKQIAAAGTALNNARKQGTVTVMVMEEMAKPRPTYLLDRGQYDKPDKSEVLQPDIPNSLKVKADLKATNRLELAQWLVGNDNPLTARVTINRYWQKYFGIGLVKTAEDFGTQGEWPTHLELLDWLAVTFRESGWDVKAMQKLIVSSATYRQSSHRSPELQAQDPENRLLARGPRFRLGAPMLRDQALAISGLRSPQIGGPPVKPYQPAGLWSSVAGGSRERYQQSKGDQLYRRSMYTFWKRAVAPPRMTIFDAAGRDSCKVNATVTNTPLQALALLNDVTFVEAARALAERMILEGGDNPEQRLAFGYELATADVADVQILQLLERSLTRYRQHYEASPEAATTLLANGESPRAAAIPPAEHAAYMVVANTILNLDTVVTKE